MTFYTAIASNYNKIFPYNANQLEFIRYHAPKQNYPNLLEIGSATGTLTKACHDDGYHTVGLELDDAMCQIALNFFPEIKFLRENMLNIDRHFEADQQPLMVCFGNTLVHLDSTDSMHVFLEKAYNILALGGKILLQFINYDRIIDQNIQALPTLSNDDLTFVRDYSLVDVTKLKFTATLTLHAYRQSIQNSQFLYPLRKADFEALAQNAGFSTQAYGSFKSEPWSENSLQSIFVCTKE